MMIAVYIIAGLVALIVILAVIAPKSAHIYRSTSVNLPPAKVFSQVRSLKNFDIWSPWNDLDPNMERGYRGVDGEVGSVAWWRGSKKVGEGEQEIVKLQPDSLVDVELRFLKPFKATNQSYWKIEAEPNGSKLTWGIHSTYKFPISIMMMFMNMEKLLSRDFDKGLAKYKEWAEKQA